MSFTLHRSFGPKNPLKCFKCRTAVDRKDGSWKDHEGSQVFLCKGCMPMIQMSIGTHRGIGGGARTSQIKKQSL